jgi:hypothetical protein
MGLITGRTHQLFSDNEYNHLIWYEYNRFDDMKAIRKIDTLNMQTKQIKKIQKKLSNLKVCDKENISNSKRDP